MAKNENLHRATEAKNDEFYTQYEDIQSELNHYGDKFRGKTVLCNCDDPFESNFCKFFLRNFNYLGLRRLICTSYSTSPVVGRQMTLFDWVEEPVTAGYGYVMDISEVPMANGRGVSNDDIDRLLRSERLNVQSEVAVWFGDRFPDLNVAFTFNLTTNAAVMAMRGIAYPIVVEGAVPLLDRKKLVSIPLSPELTASSVLAWKQEQPFGRAAGRFIEFVKCFLGMDEAYK